MHVPAGLSVCSNNMCGSDEDHASVRSLKCKAVAPMVFAIFNILGLGNIVLNR